MIFFLSFFLLLLIFFPNGGVFRLDFVIYVVRVNRVIAPYYMEGGARCPVVGEPAAD